MTIHDEAAQASSELKRSTTRRWNARQVGDGAPTFAHRVAAMSRRLAAAGAGPEVKVAIVADRASSRAVAAWACWSIGALVVATDPGLHEGRRVTAFRAGEPDILVADSRGLIQTRGLHTPGLRIALTDRAESISVGLLGAHVRLCDISTPRHSRRGPAHRPCPDADTALLFGTARTVRGVYYTFSDLASLGRHILGAGDDHRWGAADARLGTASAASSLLLPGLTERPTVPSPWSAFADEDSGVRRAALSPSE